MKNLPLIFCGVFATIAFSWAGLILTSQIQYGHLQPAVVGDITVPSRSPQGGPAASGKDEYIKLGCIYCHTQQIRPAELFAEGQGDIARGWGPRNTVARDYITQERVLLGTMRTGPDLANVGARLAPDWHYLHLFDPTITSKGSNMAPFAFLYKKVELKAGDAEPVSALKLTPEYLKSKGIAENIRFVPTERADNLVAYLMSLKVEGSLPEAKIKE
jgi:cytochrome c oxidase cbb3-type subunit 2